MPILLALAVIALVPEGERENSAVDTLPAGADSTLAVELAEQLPEDDGQVAIVLWTAASGEIDQAAQQDLSAQAIELLSAAGARTRAARAAGPAGQPVRAARPVAGRPARSWCRRTAPLPSRRSR